MGSSQFSAVVVLPDWYLGNIFLKTKLFFQSGPHPASGVSSFVLRKIENKEAQSELCQAFEFAQLELLDLSILFSMVKLIFRVRTFVC